MERLNHFSKFAVLALILALAAGCASRRSGDTSTSMSEDAAATTGTGSGSDQGYGTGQGDDNLYGYGDNGGASSGNSGNNFSSEEAALLAITTFYFEYDSSELRADAMRSLDVHARDLKASRAKVVLEGHTDERGTREYNMALGERRARAVQRYLTLQGVAPSQLELVSWGEERPAAFGSDEYAWAQNRRVELRAP